MGQFLRALSPRAELVVVIVGAFGYPFLGSLLYLSQPAATATAPLTDSALWSLLTYEAAVFLLLASFLYIRGWTLANFGAPPAPVDAVYGFGLALAVFAAVYVTMVAAISSGLYQPATETAIVAPGLTIASVVAISIVNPIFEEVFVCGFIIAALAPRTSAWTAINVSVAIRLACHLYQGVGGVILIIPLGLAFALLFARTGRLLPLIVAHGLLDLAGLFPYITR